MSLPPLDLDALKVEAAKYKRVLTAETIPSLYGVTDGKAVGTYVESKFYLHIAESYDFVSGNAARGVDFPGIGVDLKVTSIRQPQSSSPFRDATQKIYGLGYHLLVFVYDKFDDPASTAARLDIQHVVFIHQDNTADFQMTSGIRRILVSGGNEDDLDAFLEDRNLPLDEVSRRTLAERIVSDPPAIGCLTISNALQWRLQYTRAISQASSGNFPGVEGI